MKYLIKIILVLFLFISCEQKVDPLAITSINGYWEIKKVVFDQGEEDKEYIVNESCDYFQLDTNNIGFRKKVKPQLDGTFLVNNTQENFKIRFDNEKVYIDYTTDYAKWSEELIAISDEKLVFKSTENNEYHYKKLTPLNIQTNGKKTK